VRNHSSSFVTAIKVSALLALLPLPARAQPLVRALTSVSAGGSTLSKGLAEPDQKSAIGPVGRASLELDLGYRTPNTNHLLQAAVGTVGYPGNGGGSVNEEAALTSDFSWPRFTLELGATGSHSELNDLEPLLESGLTGEEPPPPVAPSFTDEIRPDEDFAPVGTLGFVGGSLSQSLDYELTPRWNVYQSAGVDAFAITAGNVTSSPVWAMSADVGIQRDWTRDGGRLELTAGQEQAPAMQVDEGTIPPETGNYGRAALGWVHQLSPNWRSDLSAGAWAARTEQSEKMTFGPAWRGSLNWRGRLFRGAFIYDRSVQPSVVLGGIFVTDRASVRATGRFGRDERIRFTGLLRYARIGAVGPTTGTPVAGPPTDLTDPTPILPPRPPSADQLHDHANRWQGQLLMAYLPWPRRMVELGLSYRLTTQTGAVLGRRRMKTFERNVLLLTLTFGLPTHEVDDGGGTTM
jgi:hypothetical protein